MKIYLAAPYAARDILKEHVELWRTCGHEVTCGWVKGTRPLGTDTFGVSPASTDDEVAAHAAMDLADIDEAEVLVHYTAEFIQRFDPSLDHVKHNLHSGGRHTETGYALATGKPVIVLGPPENIFQRGMCSLAETIEEALEILEEQHG